MRELETEVGRRLADEIAGEPGSPLLRVLEGASLEQLRAVSRAVLALRPEAVVALVGGGVFLVESGSQGPADVAALGAALRDTLGAKGGGRGKLYQGSGGTLRDAADLKRAIEG